MISIVIPTLNSAKVLTDCLESIKSQKIIDHKLEILILDGGSIDDTLKIAKKYHCQIFSNSLKTAEAGKAIGVKKAKGEFIALIDSDNILPTNDWFMRMLEPFKDKNIIGSEPWEYTYRPDGGFIERYSSLTGVNDPYTLIAKNYDRISYLHSGWTGLILKIIDHPKYQTATFVYHQPLPTIGANGTVFKADFIKRFTGKFFFDVDIITSLLTPQKKLQFAKVKIGIIHTFCESSISKFYRKQYRRANDLYTYQKIRQYYLIKNNKISTLKWIFYVCLIFPMFIDTLKGYYRKPDLAWFFHPLACIITSYCYGLVTIKSKLGLLTPLKREKWQQ